MHAPLARRNHNGIIMLSSCVLDVHIKCRRTFETVE
jgi:hypothetical protein